MCKQEHTWVLLGVIAFLCPTKGVNLIPPAPTPGGWRLPFGQLLQHQTSKSCPSVAQNGLKESSGEGTGPLTPGGDLQEPSRAGMREWASWRKDLSPCSCPEHPRLALPDGPAGCLGLGSAASNLTASPFISMEGCSSINSLLSFGVNRKSSPPRQIAALCGAAMPITADSARGCAIRLLLKAASLSCSSTKHREQAPGRENRSHHCL